MTRDELIEAMARAICCPNADCAQDKPRDGYVTAIPCSRIIHMEAATAALSAIEAVAAVVPKELGHGMVDAVYDAIARSQSVNVYGLQPSERRRVMPRMVVEAMTEASPFRSKP